MRKDLHDKPFDEGTLKKLDIFEAYTKQWLPTFVMNNYESEICIFDLFAGPGYSITGQEGSPIRILKQVYNQIGNIFLKNKKVYVLFNEYDKDKVEKLEKACESFCNNHAEQKRAIASKHVQYKILNTDVALLFPKVKTYLGKYPLLLFLDQNGIKFMSDTYLQPLLNAKKVDFLFYLSSSYFNRFGNTDEFKNIIDIDLKKAKEAPYKYIHRSILEQLREKIPVNCPTRLYPFTIKKGCNVYGIIFGASHPRGVEKFLQTAWAENNINGDANFDIDDDRNKGQADLFGYVELTKIMKFRQEIRQAILNGTLENNRDAFDFALNQGHLPSHAADEIKLMKKEKLISYNGRSPLVTYEKVYKDKIILNYTRCAQRR